MQEISFVEAAEIVAERMGKGGVFLTSAAENRQNVMTIGWGGVNCFFNKGVFLAPVRQSRYTHQLMEASNSFAVSVPLDDGMRAALSFAGTQSGRDIDKFVGHGMTAIPAQEIDAPIIAECGLQIECRIISRTELNPDTLDLAVLSRWYSDRDMHTLYLGEIVKCYLTK